MSLDPSSGNNAKERILAACNAPTELDKQVMLARTWTQAALRQRTSPVDHDTPPEASAA